MDKAEIRKDAERFHEWEREWGSGANAAAIKAAEEAIKAVLLVNGGSCVAMLAFVGSLANRTAVDPKQIVEVARPIIWFASGVGLAVMAAFCAYFCNLCIAGASNHKVFTYDYPFFQITAASKWSSYSAEVFRYLGVVAVVGALTLFVRGVWLCTSAFEALAR